MAELIPGLSNWALVSFALIAGHLFWILGAIVFARKTHAFKELIANMKGVPLSLMFTDHKTVDWRFGRPQAGLLDDPVYGTFIVHEKGAYTDKRTKGVIMCYNAGHAMGAPVPAYKYSDDLMKLAQDERKMEEIRGDLAIGKLDDVKFDALRETINFSPLKSMLNAMTPHGVKAKIHLEVVRRLKSYGGGDQQALMWFALIGLGLIAGFAIVFWAMKGQGTSTSVETIKYIPTIINNASVMA